MVSAGDLSLRETDNCLLPRVPTPTSAYPDLSMLVLTQSAHSYAHVSMPTRAWLACVFKCPYLPSLVEACLYLFSPVQANTCPHLLMPAFVCPHLFRLTPAHTCLHLSLPSMLTPALTCSCPYLLVPAHICCHLFMFTPAYTCSHLPSLAHAHTCQSSTPPMSLRITSCFPTTLGLLFFLFQRLLSPSLSWLPASYPQSPLRMTLLCARARSLS